MKKLFTVAELSKATGYSKMQIHNYIASGKISTAYSSQTIVLIDRAEFDRVVNKLIVSKKLGR